MNEEIIVQNHYENYLMRCVIGFALRKDNGNDDEDKETLRDIYDRLDKCKFNY